MKEEKSVAYQIFISFKNEWENKPTRDSEIAHELYDELKKYGIEVFFSNEEVQRRGRPDYGRIIDEALDSSRILMLVGTRADFTSSRWVEYEWDLFNNEIYSGRKDGKIITVLEGMNVGELPIGMRRWQSYDLKKFKVSDAVKMAISTLETLTGEKHTCDEAAKSDLTKSASTVEPESLQKSTVHTMTAEQLLDIGLDYCSGKKGKPKEEKETVDDFHLAERQEEIEKKRILSDSHEQGDAFESDGMENEELSNSDILTGCSIDEKSEEYYYRGKSYIDRSDGSQHDIEKAIRWYKVAAGYGHAKAQYYLGYYYFHGKGIRIDREKAVKYLTLSSNQGYAPAQCLLGSCYKFACGVAANHEEAIKLYKLSAEKGYSAAQYNLAECYKEGFGLPKDYEMAKYWYLLAAQQGHRNAKKALKRLT